MPVSANLLMSLRKVLQRHHYLSLFISHSFLSFISPFSLCSLCSLSLPPLLSLARHLCLSSFAVLFLFYLCYLSLVLSVCPLSLFSRSSSRCSLALPLSVLSLVLSLFFFSLSLSVLSLSVLSALSLCLSHPVSLSTDRHSHTQTPTRTHTDTHASRHTGRHVGRYIDFHT
jgi:hypothetical protein